MTEVPYSRHLTPPAPVLDVTIQTFEAEHRIQVNALVDTGADATIVPLQLLQTIAAQPAFTSILRSPWGEKRQVLLYLVDIGIAEITLPGLYVVGDEAGDDVILGRDALNRLRLLLDGPAQILQVLNAS